MTFVQHMVTNVPRDRKYMIISVIICLVGAGMLLRQRMPRLQQSLDQTAECQFQILLVLAHW